MHLAYYLVQSFFYSGSPKLGSFGYLAGGLALTGPTYDTLVKSMIFASNWGWLSEEYSLLYLQ